MLSFSPPLHIFCHFYVKAESLNNDGSSFSFSLPHQLGRQKKEANECQSRANFCPFSPSRTSHLCWMLNNKKRNKLFHANFLIDLMIIKKKENTNTHKRKSWKMKKKNNCIIIVLNKLIIFYGIKWNLIERKFFFIFSTSAKRFPWLLLGGGFARVICWRISFWWTATGTEDIKVSFAVICRTPPIDPLHCPFLDSVACKWLHKSGETLVLRCFGKKEKPHCKNENVSMENIFPVKLLCIYLILVLHFFFLLIGGRCFSQITRLPSIYNGWLNGIFFIGYKYKLSSNAKNTKCQMEQ